MNARQIGMTAMGVCWFAAFLNLGIAFSDMTALHSINLLVGWFSGWSAVFQLEFYRREKGSNAEDGNES